MMKQKLLIGSMVALVITFMSNVSAIAADNTNPTNQNSGVVAPNPPPKNLKGATTHAPSAGQIGENNPDGSRLTPTDQSLTTTDVETTRLIREALMDDNSLSTSAQNVKIITSKGVITLRGAVKSSKEHRKVLAAAKKFMGTNSVNDRLKINVR